MVEPWDEAWANPNFEVGFPIFGHSRVPVTWGFRSRVLKEHLVYLVVSGGFRARLPDVDLELGPDEILWLQPGVEHGYTTRGEEFQVFHLRLALGEVRAPFPGDHLHRREASQHRELFRIAQEEVEGEGEGGILRSLVHALLSGILRESRRSREGGLEGLKCRRLVEWHRERVRERPLPADMARHLGLSEDYFTRLFRRSFGRPPRRWLLEQRIHAIANELLESTRPVGELARDYGYENAYLLSRQFREVMGHPPSRYRRMHTGSRELRT